MNPDDVPFNALTVRPTNSGYTRYLVNLLSTAFRGMVDYFFIISRHLSTTRNEYE